MSDLDKFTRLDKDGRKKADALEATLEAAIARVLQAWHRLARKNFAKHAHGAAWSLPDADEILNRLAMQLQLEDELRPLRVKVVEQVMRDTLIEFGISFDVKNPLVQGVLEQLGRHITNITEDYRQGIMKTLDDAWREGLSIPDAASRISETYPEIARQRAKVIARTELLGAVNGGSLAAAKLTGVAKYKTWLATLDGRTRPSHAEANGQTVAIDQDFSVGGATLHYPGDFTGPAEEVVSCRCSTTYSNTPAGDIFSLLAAGRLGGRMSATPFKDLPLGARDESWDGGAAVKAMDGEAALTQGHFWKDPNGDPESKSSYKLPFAAGGHAVWSAVTAAAAAVQGGRGGVDIPADDVAGVQGHIERYYQKASKSYDDDSIVAPWAGTTASGMASRASVTGRITRIYSDLTAAAELGRTRWQGEIMFADTWTSDNRLLVQPPGDSWEDGTAWHRDLPLPFQALFEDSHGGMVNGVSVNAGQIDVLEWRGNALYAEGTFNDDPESGQRALAAAESGDMVGVSVDTEMLEWEIEVPASAMSDEGFAADDPTVIQESLDDFEKLRVTKWRLMGVTQVPFPAFEEARIMVATGGGVPVDDSQAVTASAAGLAPVAAPSDWFQDPELDGPTPLTVEDSGRVYGHAALWDSCHTAHGISLAQGKECLMPPKSQHGYAYYMLGQYHTADKRTVDVGVITMDTGHAPMGAGRADVTAHYDHTGTHAAYVVTGEDEHGIWFSGTLAPDVPASDVVRLRASKLSGDWRNVNGHLELVGILAVNTPGFPVPRARIAASAGIEEVVSLVAAGSPGPVVDEYAFQRAVLRITEGREGLLRRITG